MGKCNVSQAKLFLFWVYIFAEDEWSLQRKNKKQHYSFFPKGIESQSSFGRWQFFLTKSAAACVMADNRLQVFASFLTIFAPNHEWLRIRKEEDRDEW